MSSTIELPSGKILDMTRFVALFPEDKTIDSKYSLILEGYSHPIDLDPSEVVLVKQYLQVKTIQNQNGGWNQEEQIRKNQPAMKLLREWIERDKNRQPTRQSEAAFEGFKKIIDVEDLTAWLSILPDSN